MALQNASHLQETERRATRLAALNDMGQKIAGNLELSEVFDRIVHAVAGILKTDYSRIFMIDEKEQELVLRASHGRIPISPGRVASIKMGESVTGWASQKGESLLVPDVLKNPFWEDLPWEWVPKKEIRALICQPLHHRGQIIGYINGMSRQEGFFTEEDLSTLGVLASQAAGAIENARLFSDTRERATRLEFVGNIAKAVGSTLDPEELFRTIVDEILRVVPCERCVIGKVDQTEMPNFSYWHTGSEIGLPPISTEEKTEAIEWYIRNVYSRNQTAYLQNLGELETPWSMRQVRAGFNSLLAVPILQDGTCIAHFSLTSSRTNAFSGGQVEFLTSVAGHLGSVIRNASLYQTAEERAVRLASLNEVNLKITQNLALGEVLENVARSAVELLSGSFSRVYLLNEESGLLQIRTHFGDIGAPPKFDAHRPEKGLRGVVFQTGKPVLIQNILEDEWFEEKAWAEESGLRGFIAVPVFHEDRVIGVLNCMGKESVSFSRDDADLLSRSPTWAARLFKTRASSRSRKRRENAWPPWSMSPSA
ncbi:MAG: GAF domain-containing protein [Nitrospinota bacterium]